MKKNRLYSVIVILLLLPMALLAQSDKTEITKLKAAVEKDINNPKVHEAYIKAVGTESLELEKQYDKWMLKFPKMAMVPYALAKAYLRHEDPKAKLYLLKTVAIDPRFSEAWSGLSDDAQRWGESKAANEYLEKAAASDPSNAKYAFALTMYSAQNDKVKYKQMSLDLVKRFPNDEVAAQSLYWLAELTPDVTEKIKFYETLRNHFPTEKFNWSSFGMNRYYDLLLTESPEKAVALAEDMVKTEKEKQWPILLERAQKINKAKTLMAQRSGTEALAVLKSLKLPRYSDFNDELVLLKSACEDMNGNTAGAYDSLLVFFVKNPSKNIKSAISSYGSKLGKQAKAVDADIWKQIELIAQPATPFSDLKLYLTPGKTSLSDYKGKVVLLTYWFPGCGPCRAEFPHFENVVKQFKANELAYLGINIVSKQNDYVVPFMKGSGYSFIPIEDVKDRIKGNLDNKNMAPVNFLIDQKGRLIFSRFRTDAGSEADLKMMIDLLLSHS